MFSAHPSSFASAYSSFGHVVPTAWEGSVGVHQLNEAERVASRNGQLVSFAVNGHELASPGPFANGVPGAPVVAYLPAGSAEDETMMRAVELLVMDGFHVAGAFIASAEGIILLRLDQRLRSALIDQRAQNGSTIRDTVQLILISWRDLPTANRSSLCALLRALGFKCKAFTINTISRQGGITTGTSTATASAARPRVAMAHISPYGRADDADDAASSMSEDDEADGFPPAPPPAAYPMPPQTYSSYTPSGGASMPLDQWLRTYHAGTVTDEWISVLVHLYSTMPYPPPDCPDFAGWYASLMSAQPEYQNHAESVQHASQFLGSYVSAK